MAPMKEMPVYLFTGFLDSGKTTFIQETLEDPNFNGIEKTLVILCEEGEVELEPAKFADYNVDIIHSDTYEIKLLSTAFNNMARNLEEHERIQSLLAYRDSLTGLKNTNSYRVWVSEFDKAAEKPETAIIMIDLNCLKETNDRYGHEAGDRLIVAAAHLIADTFKRSHVFRIGGDEFLVVLRNRDLKEYGELMKKLLAECAKRFITADGEMLPVSLAMGYARYDSDEDTSFVDVFNKADDAMYENKRGAKGLN